MKTENIVLLLGAGLLGWYLAPKEVKEKIAGSGGVSLDLSGLLSGVNFGGQDTAFKELSESVKVLPETFKGMLTEFDFPVIPEIPAFQFPDFPALPEMPDFHYTLPPLIDIPNLPDTVTDTGGSLMPEIALPNPANVGQAGGVLGGIALRQITGSAITGGGIASRIPVLGEFLRASGRFTTEVTEHVAPRIISRIAPRIAPKIVIAGSRLATRGVPVVGWALLVADAGADLARIFGVDMPEWVGYSPIIGAFTGENPLESWSAQGQAEQELSMYNPSIDSESGQGYAYLPYLGVDFSGMLAHIDAGRGQPESPSLSAAEYDKIMPPADEQTLHNIPRKYQKYFSGE